MEIQSIRSIKTKHEKLLYVLLALMTVGVWGITFVSTKTLIVSGLTPVVIFIIRFAIAYLCILTFSHKILFAKTVKDEMSLLFAGLTGGSIYFITENSALGITFASNVSLIICTSPIFTMIFGRGIFHDNISVSAWIGSFISLAGVAVVILNGSLNYGINPLGDILTVVAAISWATYCLILKRLNKHYDNLFITRKVFGYGTLTAIAYLTATNAFEHIDFQWTFPVIGNLLFLGIIASFLCYLMWNASIKMLGPEMTANFIYLVPLVTIIASYIILDEPISVWTILGACPIIGGIILATKQ